MSRARGTQSWIAGLETTLEQVRGVEKMPHDCTSKGKWFLGAWMSMNKPPEGANAGVSFLT